MGGQGQMGVVSLETLADGIPGGKWVNCGLECNLDDQFT